MKRDKISLIELVQKFPTNKKAEAWLIRNRWSNGIYCPHCDSTRISERVNTKNKSWRCKDCLCNFTVKTGSVMHSSNLDFKTWVYAIYLVNTNIKGIASTKLASDLKIRQATAWHLAMRLRETYDTDIKMRDVVEVDESFFGGKEANKHSNKKLRAGRGGVGKQTVLGMVERGGNTKGIVIDTNSRPIIFHNIRKTIEWGSTIYTDDHKAYIGLHNEYTHRSVNHSENEYVRGTAHTNGIESFWALLKRGYYGTFHSLSAKHLQRYINEFAGKANERKLDTMEQMKHIVSNMNGRRVSYASLVA